MEAAPDMASSRATDDGEGGPQLLVDLSEIRPPEVPESPAFHECLRAHMRLLAWLTIVALVATIGALLIYEYQRDGNMMADGQFRDDGRLRGLSSAAAAGRRYNGRAASLDPRYRSSELDVELSRAYGHFLWESCGRTRRRTPTRRSAQEAGEDSELWGGNTKQVRPGLRARRGDFPWYVSLWSRSREGLQAAYYICAAVLVSDRHLLTTAACGRQLYSVPEDGFERLAVAGEVDRTRSKLAIEHNWSANVRRVVRALIHADYNPDFEWSHEANLAANIALVLVDRPWELVESLKRMPATAAGGGGDRAIVRINAVCLPLPSWGFPDRFLYPGMGGFEGFMPDRLLRHNLTVDMLDGEWCAKAAKFGRRRKRGRGAIASRTRSLLNDPRTADGAERDLLEEAAHVFCRQPDASLQGWCFMDAGSPLTSDVPPPARGLFGLTTERRGRGGGGHDLDNENPEDYDYDEYPENGDDADGNADVTRHYLYGLAIVPPSFRQSGGGDRNAPLEYWCDELSGFPVMNILPHLRWINATITRELRGETGGGGGGGNSDK